MLKLAECESHTEIYIILDTICIKRGKQIGRELS